MLEQTTAPITLAHTEAGSGPPVVLMMGLNASGAAWQPHLDQWATSFRCIAVDNRGAGNSPAPAGPYSTAVMADDYAELIHRLGLGRCRVVGISMGGAIAQQLALRHPGLVERLVLVASWARCDPYIRDVLRLISAVRAGADEMTFTTLLQTLIWTPGWFRNHDQELVAARGEALLVGPAALDAQVSACLTHNTVDRLAQITVPTLITAGGQDRFIPVEAGRLLAEQIPGARLEVFADTGHVHHWEELARFNDLVEEWLR